MSNENLNMAKSARNDEFYTQYEDIEKELRHYRQAFDGKTIYCPCDNPTRSNFFRWFVDNFVELGIKKLIATSLAEGVNRSGLCCCVDSSTDIHNIEVVNLDGGGDFRSAECLAFLDESDIVVTNPPFSMFREFFRLMVERRKKFIVVGNLSEIKCRDVFPYFRDGSATLGAEPLSSGLQFVDQSGELKRMGFARWFTNVKHGEKGRMLLFSERKIEDYPRFDNYDAISVDRIRDVPNVGSCAIGVPITVFDYDLSGFEITGVAEKWDERNWAHIEGAPFKATCQGAEKFARVFIQRKLC